MTSAMTNSNTAKRKPVAMNGVDTPALLAMINAVGAQQELAKFWRMSAFGTKRTSASALHMSAFGAKADMPFCTANVR